MYGIWYDNNMIGKTAPAQLTHEVNKYRKYSLLG